MNKILNIIYRKEIRKRRYVLSFFYDVNRGCWVVKTYIRRSGKEYIKEFYGFRRARESFLRTSTALSQRRWNS